MKLSARVEALAWPDRRIFDRLDISGECWLWTGALDARGRGRVWRNGKIMLHHRAVWEMLIGAIPDGALLCHHCDNPTCANPEHLYVGDSKTNVRDMFDRKRHWTQKDPERARVVGATTGKCNTWTAGEGNPKSKLTERQVAAILADARSGYAIAKEIGLHPTTIQRIKRGDAWKKAAALRARNL